MKCVVQRYHVNVLVHTFDWEAMSALRRDTLTTTQALCFVTRSRAVALELVTEHSTLVCEHNPLL